MNAALATHVFEMKPGLLLEAVHLEGGQGELVVRPEVLVDVDVRPRGNSYGCGNASNAIKICMCCNYVAYLKTRHASTALLMAYVTQRNSARRY